MDDSLQVDVTSGSALNFTGGITAGVVDTSTLSFDNAGVVTVGGTGIGTGMGVIAVVLAGSGVTTFAATNSYLGTTTVNSGTLLVDGSLTNASLMTVNDSATLGGTGTIARPVLLYGGAAGATLESAGTLSLSNTLSIAGANNAIAGGTIDVAGKTTIAAGAALAVNGVLTGSGIASLNNGATLSGSGTVSKAVVLAGADILEGNPTLALGGTLAVNGSGNLIAGGRIDVAGGTTIGNAADLTVAGELSGALTVSGGAKLIQASTGALLGNVTVATGGIYYVQIGGGMISSAESLTLDAGSTFDPTGGAIGIVDLTGSGTVLTLSGATLDFNLAATGAAADSLNVTAGTAAVGSVNTINLTALGANLAVGQTYKLISARSGLTGTFRFANGATTETYVLGNANYQFSLNNSPSAETVTVAIQGDQSQWTTYQGNPDHTGYVPTSFNARNLSLEWRAPLGGGSFNGVVVGDGTVFVTHPHGTTSLWALDQASGVSLWSGSFGNIFSTSPPAYAGGAVYFQTDSGGDGIFLRAYAARTGANIFNAPYLSQHVTYLNPVLDNANVYVGGGEYGGMYSFNASTGSQNWFGNVPQNDGWTPAIDGRYAYTYTGSGSTAPITGIFEVLDLKTGAVVASYSDPVFHQLGFTVNSAVVLGPNHDAFTINNGRLVSWDITLSPADPLHIAWSQTNSFSGQPTLANGDLYVISGGALDVLDESTGSLLWSWSPPSGSLSGPMIATDGFLFATTSTETFAVDLSSEATAWSYPISGILALSDDTLFIGGTDGAVYAFAVPEPSSIALLLLGAIGLLGSRRIARRRSR